MPSPSPRRVRMTTVDWAVVCDLAYFDRFNRLCMIGLETSGQPRRLPAGNNRLALAIHLQDRDPHDEPDVAVFVTSPGGHRRVADEVRDFCIESRGEYLLILMPSISLQEEGVYRFEVACGTNDLTMCEVSVLVHSRRPGRVDLHGAH
jgi:hypothetical protein